MFQRRPTETLAMSSLGQALRKTGAVSRLESMERKLIR